MNQRTKLEINLLLTHHITHHNTERHGLIPVSFLFEFDGNCSDHISFIHFVKVMAPIHGLQALFTITEDLRMIRR